MWLLNQHEQFLLITLMLTPSLWVAWLQCVRNTSTGLDYKRPRFLPLVRLLP